MSLLRIDTASPFSAVFDDVDFVEYIERRSALSHLLNEDLYKDSVVLDIVGDFVTGLADLSQSQRRFQAEVRVVPSTIKLGTWDVENLIIILSYRSFLPRSDHRHLYLKKEPNYINDMQRKNAYDLYPKISENSLLAFFTIRKDDEQNYLRYWSYSHTHVIRQMLENRRFISALIAVSYWGADNVPHRMDSSIAELEFDIPHLYFGELKYKFLSDLSTLVSCGMIKLNFNPIREFPDLFPSPPRP